LPQLSVLLRERNVSRAAARVGVTQPTMSRTLGLARQLVGDELITRTSSGSALTTRGEDLLRYATAALQELEAFWSPAAFAPQGARGPLELAATDHVSQTYLPPVLGALRREAPQLRINVTTWSAEALARLERDELHLAVNPLGVAPRGIRRRRLAVDRYVVVRAARKGAASERIGLEEFVAAPHVLTTTEGSERGVVDRELRRRGRRRNILARVSDFQTAAALVGASDLVATLPERVALAARARFQLALSPPPIALPTITIDVIWHERRQHDPLLAWARAHFAEASHATSGAR
jgi:DNA-binding transcriptional LysR family regulator